ncbi:MAG: DNA internalization-related competence protein ComEC/Rec2 [Firmicutes bacterium]|nr:DNA internalization-related competence protein ComEC/Rec2 [Candidatus Alectryobacillus merdavium]
MGISISASLKYKAVEVQQEGIFIVEKVSTNYYLVSNYVDHFYVYEKNNEVDEGDFLKLEGNLSRINFVTLESEFDFKNYLKTKGVEYQLYVKSKEVIFQNPINPKNIKQNLIDKYSEENQALLKSLLFSQTDYDSDIIKSSNSLNLISLISFSGIFINTFINLLIFLFGLKFNESKSRIFSFLILVPYFIINIFELSVLRIFLLNLGKTINVSFFNKKYTYLDVVCVVGIFILLLNPYNAMSLSFILGFGMSLTYILLLNFSNKKITTTTCRKGLLLSLFLIPIQLNFNKSFNLLTFLYQIVLIPLMNCIFIFSIVSLYLGYNPLLDILLFPIVQIFKGLANLKFVLYHDSLPLELLIIYYLLFYAFIYVLEKEINLFNKKITGVFCLTVVIGLLPYKNIYEKSVNFINVGQGDSILIRDRNTNVLIDTGGLKYKDLATSSLINYFKKKEVYKLDVVIITHDDFDHNGALNSLITYFPVKQVLTSYDEFPYKIGNLLFENFNIYNFSDSNDRSLVLMLNFYGNKFLFMGDASKDVEEVIMKDFNVDADYIKLGHHGSKTSTGEEFIRAVSPKEAIISCGLNNYYGHPNKEVLDILEKEDIKIRRTDLEGTISYYF